MNSKSLSIISLLVLLATMASAQSPRTCHQLARRPRLAFLGVGLRQSPKIALPTSTDFALRPSSVAMFSQPPPKRTRENEPDEYFKTNMDKMTTSERFADPLLLLVLGGILLPFIAVGIIIQSGLLTQ